MSQLNAGAATSIVVTIALFAATESLAGQDTDYRQMTTADGTRVEFRVVAPDQGGRSSYPFLLALPQGQQTRGEVDWEWQNLYRDEAQRRGWVVVSPVAPDGRLFFRGAEEYLPELLDSLSHEYPPEGGKYHLAGVSNGGLAAFAVAIEHPQLFQSIAVFPGWPAPKYLDRLDRLVGVPLKMWAGEREAEARLELMRQAATTLRAAGGTVDLEIRSGEGHALDSLLGGHEVFEYLETHR